MIGWKEVQRRFNLYGKKISKNKAKAVSLSLPAAAIATGWSESMVLNVTAANSDNGALDRLLLVGGNREG